MKGKEIGEEKAMIYSNDHEDYDHSNDHKVNTAAITSE